MAMKPQPLDYAKTQATEQSPEKQKPLLGWFTWSLIIVAGLALAFLVYVTVLVEEAQRNHSLP